MGLASVPTAPVASHDLAAKLWWVSLLRGVAALLVAAYVFSREIASPAVLAHAVAGYWVLDGFVALWASRFAATFGTTRVWLVARGATGLVAALIIFALPLAYVFGPWRPGQLVFLVFTVTPALAAIALQLVLALTIDVLIGLEVQRRLPREWSVLVGAVVSVAFASLVAAGFLGPPDLLGRALGVVGVVGGLGLIAGALRLRHA